MLYPDLNLPLYKICSILRAHSVEYLIVGGTALGLHGYDRLTMNFYGEAVTRHDFDFWFNPNYKNYYNLLNALQEYGIDVDQLKQETSPNPKKSFLKFKLKDFDIDLLPEISGLIDFRISYSNKYEFKIENEILPVLSLEDILISKKTLGRPKDLEDILQLEFMIESKKKSR